jgi:hypothetical protein
MIRMRVKCSKALHDAITKAADHMQKFKAELIRDAMSSGAIDYRLALTPKQLTRWGHVPAADRAQLAFHIDPKDWDTFAEEAAPAPPAVLLRATLAMVYLTGQA